MSICLGLYDTWESHIENHGGEKQVGTADTGQRLAMLSAFSQPGMQMVGRTLQLLQQDARGVNPAVMIVSSCPQGS